MHIDFYLAYYDEVPSVHHSLTDCSLPLLENDYSTTNKSSDTNERRPLANRRILTNGLLLSHCASNPTQRRAQQSLPLIPDLPSIKPKSEAKLSSDSSSSSEVLSSPDDKFLSRSDFILQHEQNISPQRKASSLKSIYMTSSQPSSKILYPIDFEDQSVDPSWYQNRSSYSHKVPTSDSGIVIDTMDIRPTSKSSIEEVSIMSYLISNVLTRFRIIVEFSYHRN
jgi:hypothetical protein